MREVTIWMTDGDDATVTETLNKARDAYWWYWTIFTTPVLQNGADVKAIAAWCEQNASMFINNQSGDEVNDIRSQNVTDDIASELTQLGNRHVFTAAHASNAHSGTYLAKHFAAVNYSADRSTITGEFKKSPGVLAEDLKGSRSEERRVGKECRARWSA